MKTTRWLVVANLFGVTALIACENAPEPGSAPEAADLGVEPKAEAAPSGLRLEEAQRKLDRGDDLAGAIEALEALVDDETLSSDDKDAAKLALSRAYAAKGDPESAIDVLEDLLKSHSQSGPFAARDVATKRLRVLLTGSDVEESYRPNAVDVTPGARMLAKEFGADAEGNYLIDMNVFGTVARHDGILWQIAEAKRQDLEAALSPKINVGQSITSSGSWTGLPTAMGEQPADMPQADRSMVAFYFDLGAGRVPSRYDAYLPMPSDEIAGVLEAGDGLIAIRRRPNAKPTLVIAAPRAAQLTEVEDVLDQMTAPPTEPVRVPLTKGLRPGEIRSTIRTARKDFRQCYEALLASDPRATGKVDVAFRVDGSGAPLEVTIGEGSTLRGAGFESCMTSAVAKLKFTATGEATKITYPLTFTP